MNGAGLREGPAPIAPAGEFTRAASVQTEAGHIGGRIETDADEVAEMLLKDAAIGFRQVRQDALTAIARTTPIRDD
jgi:hypothetical protein